MAGVVLVLKNGYDFYTAAPSPPLFYSVTAISVFGTVSFAVAVFFFRRYRNLGLPIGKAILERDLYRQRLEAAASKINEILCIDYGQCMLVQEHTGEAPQHIRDEFGRYTTELLTLLSDLFRIYTGSECAACLKLLRSSPDTSGIIDLNAEAGSLQNVYTFARDTHSRTRRSKADKRLGEYKWSKNAAFANVMNSVTRSGYFHSNDLKAMGDDYWNDNERWRDFYNATAVCVLKSPENDGAEGAVGFLCVDNLHGGFDDGICRQILECASSIVYYTLQITELSLHSNGSGSNG